LPGVPVQIEINQEQAPSLFSITFRQGVPPETSSPLAPGDSVIVNGVLLYVRPQPGLRLISAKHVPDPVTKSLVMVIRRYVVDI
jgi:hypothetical protein